MLNRSENQHVNYSLSAMSDALYQLMKIHKFKDITITELCSAGQLTRKTFYRNCETKLDLIDYKIHKNIKGLFDTVDLSDRSTGRMYRYFFDYWYSRREFLTITYKQGFFSRCLRHFTVYSKDKPEYDFLNDFLREKENVDQVRLFYNAFIIGGLCNMLECWVMNGFKLPIDELIHILNAFRPEVQ